MCGIAGIFNLNTGVKIDKRFLRNINLEMTRRGPDKSGFWYSKDEQIGLAHNRLSFIDLHHRSDQPMEYHHGRYVITYNGEIYNYQSLQKKLISRGYSFKTKSDTEVIMAMYDCYGSSMLLKLRGMFSFAIWDKKNQKLFAARDPFGIKPFYYYIDAMQFIFASQVKAISRQKGINLTASAPGWCGFIKYGSVPEPYSIYEQIRSLPAGNYMEIDRSGKTSMRCYFSIYDVYSNIENADASKVDLANIDQALSETVDYHLIADVPVGLLLSSGIDSNIIGSCLKEKENENLVAFTLDFDEFDNQQSESKLARISAENYGIKHKSIKLNDHDADLVLDDFFASMDQPSIDGLNIWMISKAISEAGFRAVLSGLGGDEVLAGYPSFYDVPKYSKILKLMQIVSNVGIPIEKISNLKLATRFFHPKTKGFMQQSQDAFLAAYRLKRNLFLDQELTTFFSDDFINHGQEELATLDDQLIKQLNQITNPYLKVSALEIDNYMKNQLLRDADWASMHHSLELRVPFIDWQLIKACATELSKMVKPTKRSVIRQTLNGRLPNQILSRQKMGFETPVKNWMVSKPTLQHWKNKNELLNENCPWARRWAYEVKTRFVN